MVLLHCRWTKKEDFGMCGCRILACVAAAQMLLSMMAMVIAQMLFNLRHSALRVMVERAFGSLKRRFKILDNATPFFSFPTQVDIVVACCIIHNWVIQDGGDEMIIQESDWPIHNHASSSSGQASEHALMVNFRQQIADQMWQDYQNYHVN
jgi:hypothetical protein